MKYFLQGVMTYKFKKTATKWGKIEAGKKSATTHTFEFKHMGNPYLFLSKKATTHKDIKSID